VTASGNDENGGGPWARVAAYGRKPERVVVGLMSGTSVDGVDAALVRIEGRSRETRATLAAFATYPFPAGLRADVLRLSHGGGAPADVSRLAFALGGLFGDAALAVLESANVAPADVDAVASHGQTISHTPRTGGSGDDMTGATLQIGEPAVIAARTGIAVVSNFRAADVALGGQGAPLIPYADWLLLTHPARTRVIQNIGGIGNLTYLPAGADASDVLGFDTGPGNMLMDRAAREATNGEKSFDENGTIARAGGVDQTALTWLLAHPFLAQTPPKSAGREEFGEAFYQTARQWFAEGGLSPADALATLTAFTARSVADAYRRFLPRLPDEVIVGGGGAQNPYLLELLARELAPVPVLTHENVGINGSSKEAVAFALLADGFLRGEATTLPRVTGAARGAISGSLTLPP